jgi:AcrR family transcriptional regulator
MADEMDARVRRSRAAVLAVCVELMVERGVHAVTVDSISERSGVAKSTIYRHWTTREDVIADAWTSLRATEAPDPTDDLQSDVRAYLGWLAGRLDTPPLSVLLPDLMAASERDPASAALFEQVLRDRRHPLGDRLRRAAADGELPAHLDVELAVSLLIGPLLHRRLLQRERLDDAWLDRVVASVLGACADGVVTAAEHLGHTTAPRSPRSPTPRDPIA